MRNPSQYIPAVTKIPTNQRDEGETVPTKTKNETESESKKTFRMTPMLTTPGGNSHVYSPLELHKLRQPWSRLQLPRINTLLSATHDKQASTYVS